MYLRRYFATNTLPTVDKAVITTAVQWKLAIKEKNTKLRQNLCDTAQEEMLHFELNKASNLWVQSFQKSMIRKPSHKGTCNCMRR